MDRLGYTAASAASRSMRALQVHANNLANVNTSGFRGDMERAEQAQVKGYGYDSRHLVVTEGNGVNMAQGTMMATGRDLDFAVQGAGMIVVQDGDSEGYTRAGNIQIDSEGMLTINNHAVMGAGGPIVLPEHNSVTIGSDGTVSVMPTDDVWPVEVDRIRLVDVPASDLQKKDSGLLVRRDGQPAEESEDVRLVGGYLESSNVTAISELTSSMSLSRLFESQVKMMKAADTLAEAGNRMMRG